MAQLGGDEESGCVWLDEPGRGTRWAALWPRGFRAAFNPIRIYTPSGRMIWREGTEMDLSGGPSTVHVDRIPPACRISDDLAWWVPHRTDWT